MRLGRILSLLIFPACLCISAQAFTIGELFRNSYRVYEGQRTELGVYRDSTVFSGEDYHPGSTANVGIGLISLCIADTMEWSAPGEALTQAHQTLSIMLDGTPEFYLERNHAGVLRHFFNLTDGSQAWNSEFSTIDTAIYMCGALFAKNYFQDESLSELVDRQYREIDWSKMIADAATGGIYRELDHAGNGIESAITYPFNEYMIVAYLAFQAEDGIGGPATDLWNNFYTTPATLPKTPYLEEEQLTDQPDHFVSHFISQFCYYLCPAYTASPNYLHHFRQTLKADHASFPEGISWGLGAGETVTQGYRANHFGSNDDLMASPAVVGGFSILDPELTLTSLLQSYQAGLGVYQLGEAKLLWRHSLKHPTWSATCIQGIDYSTMLFGLATLPEHCGADFFLKHNAYALPIYGDGTLPGEE